MKTSTLIKNRIENASCAVLGLGVSNIPLVELLLECGNKITVYDKSSLENLGDKAPKTLKLLELVCDEGGEDGHSHDGHDHGAYDEHVWLSLKNAETLVFAIADAVAEACPAVNDTVKSNAERYAKEIKALDGELEAAITTAERKTMLFADRFPFKYLTEDYGIEYFAAFSGCSADSEASFETVATLASVLDEKSLPYVIVLESSDKKLAETVISTSKGKSAEILVLDSIQSISKSEIERGAKYIDIMKSNAETIKTALGCE